MNRLRPTWAEIDLDAIAHNMREIRRLTEPNALVTAVIKADGYGHGANNIAQTLLDHGADRFAVATLTEAISLRRQFKHTPILVLGYTPDDYTPQILAYNIVQTIYTKAQAESFSIAALKANQKIKVHLKIDTGMHRLGFNSENQDYSDILACFDYEGIEIEGVYTHFACADAADKSTTHQQAELFIQVIDAIESAGHVVKIKHAANSATIIDMPEYHFDMVRAGIALYGLYPSEEVNKSRINLKQAMQLKTEIAQVKKVKAGSGISYGHTYVSERDEYIATLPIGYDDGYSRLLSNRVDVIINGNRTPLVGRVCMDQVMVKLPDDLAKRGDVVTLYGGDQNAFIAIDEIATLLNTINYEVVCNVNKRVPRVYIRNSQIISVTDGMLDNGAK